MASIISNVTCLTALLVVINIVVVGRRGVDYPEGAFSAGMVRNALNDLRLGGDVPTKWPSARLGQVLTLNISWSDKL